MGYGVTVPPGSLQVFSVDTEAEAHRLLTLACSTNIKGQFIANELVEEQTLANLDSFRERLTTAWGLLQAARP